MCQKLVNILENIPTNQHAHHENGNVTCIEGDHMSDKWYVEKETINKRIILTEDISLVEEVQVTELENQKKANMYEEVAYTRQRCI